MRHRTIVAGALLLLTAASDGGERIVAGDGVFVVQIAGVAGRMRIDPAASAMPIVTARWAHAAKLKPGPFGIGYAVGPERIQGRTAVAPIDLGQGPTKRRVGWMTPPYAAGIDGVVGPGGLPEPVVRFVLGPARAGERTVALPMVDGGGLAGGWGGSFATIDVGGAPLRVKFDPYRPRTLASAGAATRIAAARQGMLSGEVGRAEIVFGIERPVRTMTLAVPLAVGPLAIATLGVRTQDFGSAATIRDAGDDPDEIVVTASARRDMGRDRLAIGADQLARCSSLVFDKPARAIRLTC